MENKKSLISTVLLCGGLLLVVCSIFCFFGSALKGPAPDLGPNVALTIGSIFAFMFSEKVTATASAPGVGSQEQDIPLQSKVAMLTVTFVLVVIAIVLAIVIVAGLLTKKLDSKKVLVLACAISILMLVAAILALACKSSMIKAMFGGEIELNLSLGGGLVAFAVLSFISIAANVASIVLNRQPKAAA